MAQTIETETTAEKKRCGIVMPISAIDGCDASHWIEVKSILSDAISSAGFSPNLVSDADEVGVIHKRIIANLYEHELIVCDVSGKNPNVMFELGMRLAFDKPTIIVKDSSTSYSFDTSAIEHLEYPRDLRFSNIVDFKEQLCRKIEATFKASKENPNYTTFLKHFGSFRPAHMENVEVSTNDYIIEELKFLRSAIVRFTNQRPIHIKQKPATISIRLPEESVQARNLAYEVIRSHPITRKASVLSNPENSSVDILFPQHSYSLSETEAKSIELELHTKLRQLWSSAHSHSAYDANQND